ncbi:cyclophilin-like domain-containing protein, partial [Chytriomyces sp. MP71]
MGENKRVFLDVSVGAKPLGRMVVELFVGDAPLTSENFRVLCTGERGGSKVHPGVKMHYAGSGFHRVIKGFMVQGGDFVNHNGTGGESIYNGGGAFADEPFRRKHDEAFLLSSANSGPNSNRSQFFISSKALPHLDGKHVVFGRLVSGFEVFRAIEAVPTDNKDKPLDPVTITHSGELIRKANPASGSTSEATEKTGSKKKKRHSSSHLSSSSSNSSDSSDSSDSELESDSQDSDDSDARKKSRKRSKRSSSSKKAASLSKKKKSKKEASDPETETAAAAFVPRRVDSEHKYLDRDYQMPEIQQKIQQREERLQKEILARADQRRTDSSGRLVKGRGNTSFGADKSLGSFRSGDGFREDRHRSHQSGEGRWESGRDGRRSRDGRPNARNEQIDDGFSRRGRDREDLRDRITRREEESK